MPSFVPNKNAPEELAKEPDYRDGLADEAEDAATVARLIAPFNPNNTGEHYRDTIKVKVVGEKVYLTASKFTANWIEFGTVDTPVFAPLRRGLSAVGLRFDESNKK